MIIYLWLHCLSVLMYLFKMDLLCVHLKKKSEYVDILTYYVPFLNLLCLL